MDIHNIQSNAYNVKLYVNALVKMVIRMYVQYNVMKYFMVKYFLPSALMFAVKAQYSLTI